MPTIVVHVRFGVEPASPPSHQGMGKQQGKERTATSNQQDYWTRPSGAGWSRCAFKRAEAIADSCSARQTAICHRVAADDIESSDSGVSRARLCLDACPR